MTTQGQPIFWPDGGPAAIRDGAVAALTATGWFKNVFRNKTTPTKDDQIPFARVRIMRDDTAPMGDANLGTPSFDHTLTLAVIVVLKAATDDDLTATLDDFCLKTRAALLCDNDWRQTFEGIERASIHPSYPNETNDRLVEAAIEIVVTFRSAWPPYLPNDFEGVSTTVSPKQKPTWTCRLCQHENKSGSAACSVCGAPAPQPKTFSSAINLSESQP